PARDWLDIECRKGEIASLNEFEVKFKAFFIGTQTYTEKFTTMMSRRQQINEEVLTYVMSKIKLCDDLAQMDFLEVREHVVAGLRAEFKELGHLIIARNCGSCAE